MAAATDPQWQLLDSLKRLRRLSQLIFVRIDLMLFRATALNYKVELPDIPRVLEEAQSLGETVGIPRRKLQTLLSDYVEESLEENRKESLKESPRAKAQAKPPRREPPKRVDSPRRTKLIQLIRLYEGKLTESLAEIPNGLNKALVALEHECSDEDPSPEALSAIGLAERHRFKPAVAEMRRRLLEADHPTFPSELVQEGSTSLMRYYEDFEAADAKDFLREESMQTVADAEQHPMTIPAREEFSSLPWDMFRTLYLYWLYSRCRNLRYRLVPAASRMINHIKSWQEPSGAWKRYIPPHGEKKAETKEDPFVTALALLFLVIYGEPSDHTQVLEKGKRWLLAIGAKEGVWSTAFTRPGEKNILCNVLVLEALRRAGAPGDHPVIVQAEEALISWQHPSGYWRQESPYIEETWLTAIVVQYLRSRALRGGNLPNDFLISGRALIARAENLALSSINADARLAVIAAYHGLEHVLYGWLLVKDDEGEIFRGKETVGFREALKLFETLAQRKGWIGPAKGLPFRTQLGHLATNRDHIVHQGASIEVGQAESHVAIVRQFVQKFDQTVLGASLLD